MIKKYLRISGLVLINLILIGLGLLLYEGYIMEISRITEFPNELEGFLAVPIIIIGLIFFIKVKKYRPFVLGLTVFSAYLFIFLVFYTNKSFASKGEYESFEIRSLNWGENGFYLNIGFNMWYNSTEVTQEKYLDVDSVQVRIDNGFFGMRTMSNDLRIVENFNCEPITFEENTENDHLKKGTKFFHKRCFTNAIKHYTKGIEQDSLKPDGYYFRGLTYMAMEDYEKALIDFVTSLYLDYNKLDWKDVEIVDEHKLKSFTNELLKELDDENPKIIKQYIDKFNSTGYLNSYQTRIEFCMKKIKTN